MEVMSSPYKNGPDSPSRQLLNELGQLTISAQEGFYAQLEREAEEREDLHKKALAAAAAEHERVRKSVELERLRLEAQVEAEREKREAESRRLFDQQRREKAARDIEEKRREVERLKTIEAEQKKLEEIERSERKAKDASRTRQERENVDAARRSREVLSAAKQQADQSRAKSRSTIEISSPIPYQPQPPPPTVSPIQQNAAQPAPEPVIALSADSTTSLGWESEHNTYMDIHRRLKDFRTFMTAQGKQKEKLKKAMGDMRREITKSVGQLTEGKGANRQPVLPQ